MKNVPVPVYCRPLVEKDPNRKVEASLCAAGSGSNSRVGFLFLDVCYINACVCVCVRASSCGVQLGLT